MDIIFLIFAPVFFTLQLNLLALDLLLWTFDLDALTFNLILMTLGRHHCPYYQKIEVCLQPVYWLQCPRFSWQHCLQWSKPRHSVSERTHLSTAWFLLPSGAGWGVARVNSTWVLSIAANTLGRLYKIVLWLGVCCSLGSTTISMTQPCTFHRAKICFHFLRGHSTTRIVFTNVVVRVSFNIDFPVFVLERVGLTRC